MAFPNFFKSNQNPAQEFAFYLASGFTVAYIFLNLPITFILGLLITAGLILAKEQNHSINQSFVWG